MIMWHAVWRICWVGVILMSAYVTLAQTETVTYHVEQHKRVMRPYIGASMGTAYGIRPSVNVYLAVPLTGTWHGRIRASFETNPGPVFPEVDRDIGTLGLAAEALNYLHDFYTYQQAWYVGGGIQAVSSLSDDLSMAFGAQVIFGYEQVFAKDISWFAEGNFGFSVPVVFEGTSRFNPNLGVRVGINMRF